MTPRLTAGTVVVVAAALAGTVAYGADRLRSDSTQGVAGVVVDANGAPVYGAPLSIRPDPRPNRILMGSGDAGRFRIELPPGVYEVSARFDDTNATSAVRVDVRRGSFEDVRLVFPPGAKFPRRKE